jgi:uncharacterized protein
MSMARQHIIGVLSDTHVPHRLLQLPPSVLALLQGSDVILHAGDVEDPYILEPLRCIAPVYAVRGNVHWQYSTGTHDLDLPAALSLPCGDRVIWLTHGHLNFGYTMFDKVVHIGTRPTLAQINRGVIARLARAKPREADIVVFGHTHKTCGEWVDGAFYFNPGAVCVESVRGEPPSIGRIVLTAEGDVKPEWFTLDDPACSVGA